MRKRLSTLVKQPFVVMPVVAMVVFGGWFAYQSQGTDPSSAALPTEQVVDVTVGTMAKTVSAQGTVAATDSDDLKFAAAGTVTAVNVKAGQTVNKGDVLATMDSPALRQAVADAASRVADAKATLADDTASSASASRLAADRSNVTTAQDGLDQANTNLAGANLIAPYNAKIVSIGVTVGDKLSSDGTGATSPTGSNSGSGRTNNNLGGNGNAATAAVSLISLNSYTVSLGFDSSDIGSIASGQAAKIALSTAAASNGRFGGQGPEFFKFGGPATNTNANDGTTATTTPTASNAATTDGAVDSVSSVADASSGVASYPVKVTFTDSSGSFNVGATVKVDITISEIKDAVQVPVNAVTNDGTQSTVKVRNASGKDETRTVTTGMTSGSMIQVTAGLREGEQVVIDLPNFANLTRGNPSRGNGATVSGK